MASSAEAGLALSGRWAVVTGASRGIGRAVAERLVTAGARVLMVARGEAALRAAAAEVGGTALAADVADAAAVDRLAARVHDSAGGAPDILVNAAGAFDLAPVDRIAPDMFNRQVATNLIGPFLMMRAFLPGMKARGSGHILTLGSVAGRVALPGNGAYGASKAGVHGLHAVLDLELRGTGVRSTLIEPAATDTPLWDAVDRAAVPDLPDRALMLDADAVADAVVWALTRPPATAVRTIALERA